ARAARPGHRTEGLFYRPGRLPQPDARPRGVPLLAAGRAGRGLLARAGSGLRRPAQAEGRRQPRVRAGAGPQNGRPSMTPLVAYLILFVAVGVGFIFVHLVAGKFFRPNRPDPEKRTIYECGEPTIGSAWIQFDLRFYVVALLFVIFDVEVAFFFPWAIVFGQSNNLAHVAVPQTDAERTAYIQQLNTLVPVSMQTKGQ